ncbi:hypothetical protein [Nonomuraea sp. NPDC050783]|uniref:hypothetical protein n=1 Tax=Nonomuraea sp. NPDC050783 TaxID=3154634 RepID=UPI00346591D1
MLPPARMIVVAAAAALLAGVPAPSSAADTTFGFTDSFDHAVDKDPTYGLNDALAVRQEGAQRGVAYSRTPGLWYKSPAPRPWYSQVNHAKHPGTLSFWLGTSAVRLEAPVVAGADGRVAAQVTTDPVVGDESDGAWSSLVLSADPAVTGYVSEAGVSLALLVRSDGGVQAFSHGTMVLDRPGAATPDARGRYRLKVGVRPGADTATVSVNGVTAQVALKKAFPARSTLHLGAYIDDDRTTTTFDDLAIAAVAPEPGDVGSLRYLGYFAARITEAGGNHLPEVRGRSNLNWVNISDYSRYAAEVLESCAPRSCLVYTGHEFFSGCDAAGSPTCRLHPDHRERWRRLADKVKPHMDKVAGFYLKDEPFHKGASYQDLRTSAQAVKATFPDAPVMMVEASTKVNSALRVPPEVDWVGFDWYCRTGAEIEPMLRTLESVTGPEQKLFLMPQAAPLKACGSKAGYQSDADLAELQWDYVDLARRHPRVIGLLAFGLWVESTPVSRLPRTIEAHERIAAKLL